MQSTSISVALCTYNGAQFLGEQLASVAAQVRLPDELVVCDDCSSDATFSILRGFAESVVFPVHLYQNPVRLGVTGNFAKAIALCQCDLIAISDQDDVWPPDKLKEACAALERQPRAAYGFSNAELITAEGRPLGRTMWEANVHRKLLASGFPAAAQVSALLKCNVVTGATIVFRKSLLPRVLPIPATWMYDYWIACVASCTGAYGIVIPETLLAYRQHAGQVVGGPRTLRRRIRAWYRSKASDTASQLAAWEGLAIRLRSLSEGSIAPNTLKLLDNKILHLGRRLVARQTRAVMRATVVLAELSSGRYQQFSNSWQSALYDLLSRD